MRLDLWLLKHLKVRSRAQARDVIHRQEVYIFDQNKKVWNKNFKASFDIGEEFNPEHIEVRSELLTYVARSGLKLQRALESKSISVQGLKGLDVGQSTGGFTQVLLKNDATQVVGVEVGHSQLDMILKADPRVVLFEKLDIREAHLNLEFVKYSPFQFCVVDVSFISLTKIIDKILKIMDDNTYILALVKPQFELTKAQLNKAGVVKDPKKYIDVENKIIEFVKKIPNCSLEDYFPSELDGQDGNKEFFVYIKKG